MRRTATVIASNYCDLDVLLKTDFVALAKDFPDMSKKIADKVVAATKGFKEGISDDDKKRMGSQATLSPPNAQEEKEGHQENQPKIRLKEERPKIRKRRGSLENGIAGIKHLISHSTEHKKKPSKPKRGLERAGTGIKGIQSSAHSRQSNVQPPPTAVEFLLNNPQQQDTVQTDFFIRSTKQSGGLQAPAAVLPFAGPPIETLTPPPPIKSLTLGPVNKKLEAIMTRLTKLDANEQKLGNNCRCAKSKPSYFNTDLVEDIIKQGVHISQWKCLDNEERTKATKKYQGLLDKIANDPVALRDILCDHFLKQGAVLQRH
jgi:hypothetical protein